MKILAICDNTDTATGLRLAGVDSRVVDSGDEAEKLLDNLDENVGMVLINTSLFVLCEGYIHRYLAKNPKMQIVEIPDRNSNSHGNSMARYVKDAIGISIGG